MKLIKGAILYAFYFFQIRKIKRDGIQEFDRRVTAAKNKLIQDTTVPDEELSVRLLEEVDKIRKFIRIETEQKIDGLLWK